MTKDELRSAAMVEGVRDRLERAGGRLERLGLSCRKTVTRRCSAMASTCMCEGSP